MAPYAKNVISPSAATGVCLPSCRLGSTPLSWICVCGHPGARGKSDLNTLNGCWPRARGQWWGHASQPGQAGCVRSVSEQGPRLICGSPPLTCARRPCHMATCSGPQEARHLTFPSQHHFPFSCVRARPAMGEPCSKACHCFRIRSPESQESHRNQNFLSHQHPPWGLGWRTDAGWGGGSGSHAPMRLRMP